MIEFSCRCGHHFSLEQDMAASFTQCPRCHNLVDVPALSDLPNIDRDGLYKVEDAPPQEKPETFQEMVRAFRPSRRDEAGNEYDLRPSAEQIQRAGLPAPAPARAPGAAPAESSEKDRPKYDPETGERVRMIPIQPEKPSPVDPVDLPTLGYAPPGADAAGTGSILLQLFLPANLLVQGLVILLCLAWLGLGRCAVALAPISPFILPLYQLLSLAVVGAVLAHYGYTIDETGPEGRDELPRPLRNLSWADDLWGPFARTAGAIFLCFGPLLLLTPRLLTHMPVMEAFCGGPAHLLTTVHAMLGRWVYPLNFVLLLLGLWIFPAVLLSLNTSATLANLSPRRLLNGVIRTAGPSYLGICLLELPAVGIAAYQLFGRALLPIEAGPLAAALDLLDSPAGWLPLFLAGTYFAHAFVWSLGALYRRGPDHFNWELEGRPIRPAAPPRPAGVGPTQAQMPPRKRDL